MYCTSLEQLSSLSAGIAHPGITSDGRSSTARIRWIKSQLACFLKRTAKQKRSPALDSVVLAHPALTGFPEVTHQPQIVQPSLQFALAWP